MRNLAFGTLAALLLATAVQAASTESAYAQEESANVKVGVTVSAVINAKPHVGPRVSAALGKVIGETLSADVLAGPDAQARLPESARAEACLGESACLVAAGKALGVDQLLMLIIVGVGEELKIEATWVDVATGETALRPGITTADTDDSMRAAFAARASELLPTIGPRETSPTVTPPTPVVTQPPKASTEPAIKTEKRSTSKVPSLLVLGGGAMLGSALVYGGYQWAVDCDFSFGECQSSDKGALNATFDVVGAIGTVALSAGLYMVLTADDAEATPAPVGLNVGDDSFQVTYGGRF